MCSASLNNLAGPSLDSRWYVHMFLVLDYPKLDTSAEQRGSNTSVDLLATFPLMNTASMQFTFISRGAHGWLDIQFVLRSFSAELTPEHPRKQSLASCHDDNPSRVVVQSILHPPYSIPIQNISPIWTQHLQFAYKGTTETVKSLA